MIRILLGIVLISYSLSFWVMDLNLLTLDKNVFDYLLFCLTHIETLLIFVGLYLLKDLFIKRPSWSF